MANCGDANALHIENSAYPVQETIFFSLRFLWIVLDGACGEEGRDIPWSNNGCEKAARAMGYR